MQHMDVKSMTLSELKKAFADKGLPTYRAQQVYQWLNSFGINSFAEMTNLPKSLREELSADFPIYGCQIERRLVSGIDGTVKYLFRLHDGEYIESVLMQYKYGYTLCISTQVGCKMGCSFCASTIGGFHRNLYPSEMMAQLLAAQQDRGIRVSHVVLMGMGEPLDNFDNVMRFLELVTNVDGPNLGMRHISLSTCGVVPRIYDLMERDLQLTLSVSLHAPVDEIRSRIMPVNRKWGVDELLEACRQYAKHTGRRISFEYAMIQGVNDTEACALTLSKKLKGMLCHINLIPANEVRENTYKRSSKQQLAHFQRILEANGMNATVRRSLGADISASCGQLRQKKLQDGGEYA